MSDRNPLLSIIIPTKSRYPQLFELIDSLYEIKDSGKFEVIIQDNSPDNSVFLSHVTALQGVQINYFHTARSLSAPENFNTAIGNARGEYCIVVGDDDLINPYIINIVEEAQIMNIDVLAYPKGVYYWDDVEFSKPMKYFEPASLQFPNTSELSFEERSSSVELANIMKIGGRNMGKAPSFYHGLVKREVLEDIYSKFGNYVLGFSPDMSGAVTLLLERKHYHYTNVCLSIPGASYNSAAGMGRRDEHSATLDNLPDIVPKSMITEWNEDLPRIWTGCTFNAISVISVLRKYGESDDLNRKGLYSGILKENIYDLEFIRKVPYYRNLSQISKLTLLLKGLLEYEARRWISIIPEVTRVKLIESHSNYSNKFYKCGVHTINDCMVILKEYYKFIETNGSKES